MNSDVIIFVSLLACSAFFSGVETAFTSLSLVQIQEIKKKRPKTAAKIERLLNRPEIFLTTILFGNNLVNIGAATLATNIIIERFGEEYLGVLTGVLTFLILVFGEVTPKRIAISHNTPICIGTVSLVRFLSWIFRPFVLIISFISNIISFIAGPPKKKGFTVESLFHVMDIAEDEGLLENDKARMVKSIFRLSEIKVQAIMTHRTHVFSLDANLTVDEAMVLVQKEGYSRVPLYSEHRENIVGILLAKELANAALLGEGAKTVRKIMQKPVFFPSSVSIYKAFKHLKQSHINMGIVLDEYGGLAGLVTIEDIVEQILGEIYDEDDEREGEMIISLADGSYRVLGTTPLFQFNDLLDLNVEASRQVGSVAGYLASFSGKILNENDRVETPYGVFIVEKASHKRIQVVRFYPPAPEET